MYQSISEYKQLIESVPVGLYKNNPEGKCVYINQETSNIMDITLEECLGLGWINRLYPDDLERIIASWNQAFSIKSVWEEEYRFLRRDGTIIWVLVRCVFTFDEEGKNTGSVGSITNITIRKELEIALDAANQKLKELSSRDGLTGIYNRLYFDQVLSQEWFRLSREKSPLSLIFIDVDYFKLYNDYYGHLLGDNALKTVAEMLAQIPKRSADLVARYGGEEFVILLPNTGKDGALKIADNILSEVPKLAIYHQESPINHCLTVSMGISYMVPKANISSDILIDNADQALFLAKNQGRNRCVIYDDGDGDTGSV